MERVIILQKDDVNNAHNIINCKELISILRFLKFIIKQISNIGYTELKYLQNT